MGGVNIFTRSSKNVAEGRTSRSPLCNVLVTFLEICTPLQRFARFSMILRGTQNLDKRMGGVKILKKSSKNAAEGRTSRSPLCSVLITFFGNLHPSAAFC